MAIDMPVCKLLIYAGNPGNLCGEFLIRCGKFRICLICGYNQISKVHSEN